MVLEVLHFLRWIRDNSISSRLPSSRTHFSVFVSVLESLNQAKCFIHAPAHGEIVHGDLAEDAFIVNNEQATEGNTVIF